MEAVIADFGCALKTPTSDMVRIVDGKVSISQTYFGRFDMIALQQPGHVILEIESLKHAKL